MIKKPIKKEEKKDTKISSKTLKLKFMQRKYLEKSQDEDIKVPTKPEDDDESPQVEDQSSEQDLVVEATHPEKMWSLAAGFDSVMKQKEGINLYKHVRYISNSTNLLLNNDSDNDEPEDKKFGRKKYTKKE